MCKFLLEMQVKIVVINNYIIYLANKKDLIFQSDPTSIFFCLNSLAPLGRPIKIPNGGTL